MSSSGSTNAAATQEPSAQGRDEAPSPSKAPLATFSVERVSGDDPSRLVLVTHGSSSCPWRVKEVQANAKHTLTVAVGSRPGSSDRPCTADDQKRRETVSLPANVRAEDVKTIRITAANGETHTAAVASRG